MTKFSADIVRWAIRSLATHRDTGIFPRAFEYDALSHCEEKAVEWLSGQDIAHWTTRPLRRCLVAKHRYGFRVATQLDPLDLVFYTALVLEIGPLLEAARIGAADRVAISYRFPRDDNRFIFFDRGSGYQLFQHHSRDLCKAHRFMLATHIADFYPRLYLHRVENAVTNACERRPEHTRALCKLFKGWNQNQSYGIPVGNAPPRLAAELAIDDIDRSLRDRGIVFTRYVDDYRIFCDDRITAFGTLAHLATLLFEMHGVTLQPEKTTIMNRERFIADVLDSDSRKEREGLHEKFCTLMQSMSLDPYDYDYSDLTSEVKGELPSQGRDRSEVLGRGSPHPCPVGPGPGRWHSTPA